MTRRPRRVSKAPIRKVDKCLLRAGGSILQPGFKHHWWELHLECGHVVERRIRWLPVAEGAYGTRAARSASARPAPRTAAPAPVRLSCYTDATGRTVRSAGSTPAAPRGAKQGGSHRQLEGTL